MDWLKPIASQTELTPAELIRQLNEVTALPVGAQSASGGSVALNPLSGNQPVGYIARPPSGGDDTINLRADGIAAMALGAPLLLQPGTYIAQVSATPLFDVLAGTLTLIGPATTISMPNPPSNATSYCIRVADGASLIQDGLALLGPTANSMPTVESFGVYHVGGVGNITMKNGASNQGFSFALLANWRTGNEYNASRDMTAATVTIGEQCVLSSLGDTCIMVQGQGELRGGGFFVKSWGSINDNQKHGIYVHQGVSVDIDDVRMGSATTGIGSLGIACFHATGGIVTDVTAGPAPRYWRVGRITFESGDHFGLETNPAIKSLVGPISYRGAQVGIEPSGDCEIFGGLMEPPITTAVADLVRPFGDQPFTTATNILTCAFGHGFGNGEKVRVEAAATATLTGITPVTTDCYVVNATVNTLQLALTKGGAPVTITVDGNVSLHRIMEVRVNNIKFNPAQAANCFAVASIQSNVTYYLEDCSFPPFAESAIWHKSAPAGANYAMYQRNCKFSDSLGYERGPTTARPAAADAGAGGTWFDTTLNARLITDGTTWFPIDTGAGGVFGDGSGGSPVFDGVATVLGLVPAANVYTLAADIFPVNMTVNAGVTIKTAGWRIFCTGLLTNRGIIQENGNAAVGATGGATIAHNGSAQYSSSATCATAGATGGTGVGAAGTNQTAGVSAGGAGGAGGANVSIPNAGGAGGTASGATAVPSLRSFLGAISARFLGAASTILAGAGGGAGGGDGANAGGGGGGGGGAVCLVARFIDNAGGVISANGGAGGAGAAGNAAGGGPGGGGFVVIIRQVLLAAGTITANAGAVGAGVGTGNAGAAGVAGTVIQLAA